MGNANTTGANNQIKYLMETMDINKVGDDIVKSKFLSCSMCSDFLTPPITCGTSIGNVCGNCSELCNKQILNVSLNTLMKDYLVPCAFAKNGCCEKIIFFCLSTHQKNCKFSYYNKCPFNCKDMQPEISLLEHMKSKHCIDTINLVGGKALVNITYDHSRNKALILNNNLLFLVKLIGYRYKHPCCGVLYVGPENKEFTYQLTRVNSLILPYELKSDVLRNLPCWNDSICDCFLSIPFKLGKSKYETIIELEIVIAEKVANIVEASNPVTKVLECPICTFFMIPPIYQCIAGHSICNNCLPKLTICPTCKENFGGTRNYSLEALSGSVKNPNK